MYLLSYYLNVQFIKQKTKAITFKGFTFGYILVVLWYLKRLHDFSILFSDMFFLVFGHILPNPLVPASWCQCEL